MENMKYDIAIIGGGPAGIMAGIVAGQSGASVVLVEKNKTLGQKLLATGGGRCNITNHILDNRLLADSFRPNGKFLLSALSKFGVKETMDFFRKNEVKIKIEEDNRVFPQSDKSITILNALTDCLQRYKVDIKLNNTVKKIVKDKKKNSIDKIILGNNEEIIADKYIISTGGKSYPQTGSTGDGYLWLKDLGHTIVTPRPTLVPVILQEKFIKQLEGISLSQIKISLCQEKKKIASLTGDVIFTAQGISGPAVLNLSRYINEENKKEKEEKEEKENKNKEKLNIKIDLIPNINQEELDKKIQKLFSENGNKLLKNILETLFPAKLVGILCELIKIKSDKKANSITKNERQAIVQIIKSFELEIHHLEGFGKAIVTSGGVNLKEVNPKTMGSKIISNLYLAGEILDLDGPTGGFNLQVCWSTGYVAGESATKNKTI
jgi:hypothetical protein